MERTWQWCRRHLDPLISVALGVPAAVILLVAGVLQHARAIPVTLCFVGVFGLLAWRRRYPVAVATGAGILIGIPEFTRYATAIYNSPLFAPGCAAVFLYAYALGSESTWQRSLPGLIVLTVGINHTGGPFSPLDEMLTIGPWACGLVVASRRQSVAQLELRAQELEEERGIFAVQSVNYERARIARELHDIVAHCVSLIVVQANAGELLARNDPASAAEAFESISEAARQADTEIDRLVAMLDAVSPAAAPAGLRIVTELVRRVQASGLHVTCQFTGDSDTLCELSAEAAYRLVQESVTNAVKHAPGARIQIAVRGGRDTVEIEVRNDAPAHMSSGLEYAGGGHGLTGMRERVTRCGGSFEAGPTADRGWRVAAELPRHTGAITPETATATAQRSSSLG